MIRIVRQRFFPQFLWYLLFIKSLLSPCKAIALANTAIHHLPGSASIIDKVQIAHPLHRCFGLCFGFPLADQTLLQISFGHIGSRNNPHSTHFGRHLPRRFPELLHLQFRQLQTGVESKILYCLAVEPHGTAIRELYEISPCPVWALGYGINLHRRNRRR